MEEQWELAKNEIAHVRKQVRAILNINKEDPDAIVGKVIQHFFGRGSKISRFFEENLCLSDSKYLDFMHTFCMQAAYDCSVKQLYHKHSKLRENVMIEEDKYNEIWSWMANLRKWRV